VSTPPPLPPVTNKLDSTIGDRAIKSLGCTS
jgi:hypothetical protein